MQVRHEAMWKQRDEVLRLVKDEMAKSNKKKPEELTQAMWTSVVKSSTLEKNSFWNDKMGSEDLASVKGMAKRIIEEQAREEAGVRPAPHNTNSQAHKLTDSSSALVTRITSGAWRGRTAQRRRSAASSERAMLGTMCSRRRFTAQSV
jgi:hypothetical protein